jgi:hypothetical protein
LVKRGRTIINIDAEESYLHVANFRGTTGIRANREHTVRTSGEKVFLEFLAGNPLLLIAAYDNLLLGCLYESLYHEPFAAGPSGEHLGGSLTVPHLRQALNNVRDSKQLESLRQRFQQSRSNILRMASREGVELSIPSMLPNDGGTPEL